MEKKKNRMENFSITEFESETNMEDVFGTNLILPSSPVKVQKIQQNNAAGIVKRVLKSVKQNLPLTYPTFVQKSDPGTLGMRYMRQTIEKLAKKSGITTYWYPQVEEKLFEWDIIIKESVIFDFDDRRYKFVFGVNKKYFSFEQIDKKKPPNIKDLLFETSKMRKKECFQKYYTRNIPKIKIVNK